MILLFRLCELRFALLLGSNAVFHTSTISCIFRIVLHGALGSAIRCFQRRFFTVEFRSGCDDIVCWLFSGYGDHDTFGTKEAASTAYYFIGEAVKTAKKKEKKKKKKKIKF
jgi:hypothetical protein